jgi:hypothetical protein
MFLFKIYLLKLYTIFSSNFEQFFLLKKKIQSNFLSLGYQKAKLRNSKFDKRIFENIIKENKYFHRNIIKKDSIYSLLKYIFIKNKNLQYITKITGYNYSIDFILAYSTLHIEKKNQQKAIYANHWHRDKPYSKNTLKVIMPITSISSNYGPMEILSVQQSNAYNDFTVGNFPIEGSFKLIGTNDDLFIFRPNVCYHRAGNPNSKNVRSQIMLQLNPSRNWEFSEKLYEKQFKLEPKFPLLNFLEKKLPLLSFE